VKLVVLFQDRVNQRDYFAGVVTKRLIAKCNGVPYFPKIHVNFYIPETGGKITQLLENV
jgi:hypothetical protein